MTREEEDDIIREFNSPYEPEPVKQVDDSFIIEMLSHVPILIAIAPVLAALIIAFLI